MGTITGLVRTIRVYADILCALGRMDSMESNVADDDVLIDADVSSVDPECE